MGCCCSSIQPSNKSEYESLVESYDRSGKPLRGNLIDDPVIKEILEASDSAGASDLNDEDIERFIKSI